MGPFEMVAFVVLVGCGSGVLIEWLKRKPAQSKELLNEIRALREEMQQLRQQNNDVILSLDTGLQALDRRITRVETRTLPGTTSSPAEEARLTRTS